MVANSSRELPPPSPTECVALRARTALSMSGGTAALWNGVNAPGARLNSVVEAYLWVLLRTATRNVLRNPCFATRWDHCGQRRLHLVSVIRIGSRWSRA